MSLMRLLVAGSSLRGIKDRRSPYKMTQQNLLPKFGPDTPTGAKASAPASAPMTRHDVVTAPELMPPVAELKEGRQVVAEADTGKAQVPLPEAKGRPASGFFRRWAQLKNPFRPKPTARKVPEPVQGELRLESVKVVRNDLNEDDLEIVSAPKPVDRAVCSVPAGPGPEATKLVWQRIATRLFGAGRT